MRLVASLALVLLAALICRDVSVAALAPPLPWRQQGPMVSSSLSMVSQKEKRRRQDGAKRREAYEELQVAQRKRPWSSSCKVYKAIRTQPRPSKSS